LVLQLKVSEDADTIAALGRRVETLERIEKMFNELDQEGSRKTIIKLREAREGLLHELRTKKAEAIAYKAEAEAIRAEVERARRTLSETLLSLNKAAHDKRTLNEQLHDLIRKYHGAENALAHANGEVDFATRVVERVTSESLHMAKNALDKADQKVEEAKQHSRLEREVLVKSGSRAVWPSSACDVALT